MSDLENLLLEAVGRTGGSSRSSHLAPPSRRQRENANSNDGSDSKVKDLNENHGYEGRKTNWRQLPLKKRGKDRDVNQSSRGEEEGDKEGSGCGGVVGDAFDVQSELYKGDDDRQPLAQLSEHERNEKSSARWQMARISDSPPLEEEYNQWKKEVERTSGKMPTKHEIVKKKEEIKKTHSFVYSAETVKHMLQEKKSAVKRPFNTADEKERLRREMEAAKKELTAIRQAQDSKNSKAYRLAEMSKKNRIENFKNASELKPKNTNIKSVEAGSKTDPFLRRWTRPTNYYATASKNKTNDDGSEITEKNQGEKVGVVATDDPLEAALDARKLVDTSAPADQETGLKMLYNFDLLISLNTLQKFGGSQGVLVGAVARRKKIEATIGLQVPEDDGRIHKTTISISEYRRQRGML